jgi:hypothetical protein
VGGWTAAHHLPTDGSDSSVHAHAAIKACCHKHDEWMRQVATKAYPNQVKYLNPQAAGQRIEQ